MVLVGSAAEHTGPNSSSISAYIVSWNMSITEKQKLIHKVSLCRPVLSVSLFVSVTDMNIKGIYCQFNPFVISNVT